ncbi:MAG: transposase [Planctomycetota bacterium]
MLVSLDWVDIRHFQCLVLVARLRGRALPLLWAVYHHEDVYRSQNNLEYGLLRVFRTMVPSSVAATILADRGFGRTEMARLCQALTFHYVIRIQPSVWIRSPRFAGRPAGYPIHRGQRHLLRNVWYRKARPVLQHVAVIWLPDQAQPWYLMTDEDQLKASVLSKVFTRRMSIEAYFRDTTSKRNGLALRLIQIKDSQRLSRFPLVLAWAYILLVTVGLYAVQRFRPGQCDLVGVIRPTSRQKT